ncbi:Protein VHS3 [Schistosoma japonicum]|uniref:Protein VHS3 n=1 Tax=Schistosoma japonicum TaxID=6182 RepID=A0A4Z2D1D5_SCHJA|nr:Protein VHS3 [Schistosoma japonicum]
MISSTIVNENSDCMYTAYTDDLMPNRINSTSDLSSSYLSVKKFTHTLTVDTNIEKYYPNVARLNTATISSNVPTVESSGNLTPQYKVTKVNQNNQVTKYPDAADLTADDIIFDSNFNEDSDDEKDD